MPGRTLEELKRHLRPGRVYRREDFLPWSRSVDRHLKALTTAATLQKLRNGLYYFPRKFEFGEAPADERELVRAFLKTDNFVVTSPNAYNQLGLGTTQIYNKRVVYNQKRHGIFSLGNRILTFERRYNVPKQLSPEFLLVDLVNELDHLAADRDAVLFRVGKKAKEMDAKKLARAVSLYGKYSTRKKFREILGNFV
jgi:uroporphyrinogen-III synthase